MAAYWILAVLLFTSLVLTHGDKFAQVYYWVYKKFIKPKFKVGQHVMIDGKIWKIVMLLNSYPPYTYYCLPIQIKNVNLAIDPYVPERRIKPMSGILNELE